MHDVLFAKPAVVEMIVLLPFALINITSSL